MTSGTIAFPLLQIKQLGIFGDNNNFVDCRLFKGSDDCVPSDVAEAT
jgi:hypothetical protein